AAERIVDTGDTELEVGAGGRGAAGADLPDDFQPPVGLDLPDDFQPPEGLDLPDGAQAPDGTARGGFGFGAVSGVVESVDGSTFTVVSDDGTAVTVTTTAETTVSLVREARVTDLSVGDEIVVIGDDSTDADSGTIAAARITEGSTLGPAGMGGFPGGPNGGPPSGGPVGGANGTTT
ncbi:MAG: hypothetical protein ACXW1S_01135, partial [Acidimicrobiia bacterium]